MARVAIAGIGNCAASIVQWAQSRAGGAPPAIVQADSDLASEVEKEPVSFSCAFDVDSRKVGKPLSEAILAEPNCTPTLGGVRPPVKYDPIVQMGPVLDGVSDLMLNTSRDKFFSVSELDAVDVEQEIRKSKTEVLLILLPVGSREAARFYAQAALNANCAVVNAIPVLLGEDQGLMEDFRLRGLPYLGDDTKSQFGATYLHQILVDGLLARGCKINRMSQLNFGGNTDFMNMLEQERLQEKRVSKTQAVLSRFPVTNYEMPRTHIGPSDYVYFMGDEKKAIIDIDAEGAGGQPINISCSLAVIDSYNSAGTLFDAIRIAAIAKKRGAGGPSLEINEALMKSPAGKIGAIV